MSVVVVILVGLDAFKPGVDVDLDGFERLRPNLLVLTVKANLQPLASFEAAHVSVRARGSMYQRWPTPI